MIRARRAICLISSSSRLLGPDAGTVWNCRQGIDFGRLKPKLPRDLIVNSSFTKDVIEKRTSEGFCFGVSCPKRSTLNQLLPQTFERITAD